MLDAWAMLVQTQNYLATPESRDFGAASTEARAATRDVEERVEETFRWAAPDRDPDKARAEIARWAALWRAALLVGSAILLWGAVAFLLRRAGPAGPRAS
jgi:hypothetical protein